MSKKLINFRATPDLVEGLDEVVEYLKANTVQGVRITKTDAFRYLLNLFRENQNNLLNKECKK